jgi:hypothetical protein
VKCWQFFTVLSASLHWEARDLLFGTLILVMAAQVSVQLGSTTAQSGGRGGAEAAREGGRGEEVFLVHITFV